MIGHQQDTQEITLGNGCQYRGTIAHEIMHLLGFYHEHTRQDRDQYITVYDENILDGMFPGEWTPKYKGQGSLSCLVASMYFKRLGNPLPEHSAAQEHD